MPTPSGGVTTSLWLDRELPSFEGLPPPEVDVLVIGAGIAGLTCAIELARAGRHPVVIDDGPVGGGETARTSAHLASAVDDRYHVLEKKFGAEGARLVAESHAAAIDYIERLVRERQIDCAFRRVDGYLFEPFADRPRSHHELEQELAAAQRAGLTCELVAGAPLPYASGPAIKFANQAEFHPLDYLRGLVAYARELGVEIYTGVHAETIEAGEPLRVLVTKQGPIAAKIVVDATNCDMSSSFKICLQQAPYRSYCVAFALPPNAIPHGLYWETGDPYHYMRVAGDTLVVGGEDHRVGQGEAGPQLEALEHWTRRYLPVVGEVVARWSGQIMEPVDGNAHIGKSPAIPNVYLCTGDSGNGLTHGTIAGIMIPQLIAGESPAWARVYDPERNHAHAAASYMAEAARSAAPYLDWIRGGDVGSVDEIPRGTGALVRRGLSILAAYRDDAGDCHMLSATCPHLRGIVQWNAAEKSWDCPCHGSRFDAYGTVVNGPAVTNLVPIETPLPAAEEVARSPRRRDTRTGRSS
jgi:glycine/D-amino acid oxidase-like deaminating enzyme/nitrite reductase/ring-hydroxylating ferredoxin subunit